MTRSVAALGFASAVAFLVLAAPAGAQEALDPQRFLPQTGGEINRYMRLETLNFEPQVIGPGTEVTVKMTLTNLRVPDGTPPDSPLPDTAPRLDTPVQASVFGSWEPFLELYRHIHGIPRSALPRTMFVEFRFRAPLIAGRYKVRWMMADQQEPFTDFQGHGGTLLANGRLQNVHAWTEFEFQVTGGPSGEEFQRIPQVSYTPPAVTLPPPLAAIDRTERTPRLRVGEEVRGVARLERLELQPAEADPGESVTLLIRWKPLAPTSSGEPQGVSVFGGWQALSPLAEVLPPTPRDRIPGEVTKAVTVQAPSRPGIYRMRVFWTQGPRPARSFFGGLGGDLDQDPPKAYAEIPLTVQEVMIAPAARPRRPAEVAVDLCEDGHYAPPTGGRRGTLGYRDVRIEPAEPAPGEPVTLSFTVEPHGDTPIFVQVFGSWAPGRELGRPIGTEAGGEVVREAREVEVKFAAPTEPGAAEIRILLSNPVRRMDFFGTPERSEDLSLVPLWTSVKINVLGGERPPGEGLLEHRPRQRAAAGAPLILRATWIAPPNPGSLEVHVRPEGAAGYSRYGMDQEAAGRLGRIPFRLEVPAAEVQLPAVEYFIVGSTEDGHEVTAPEESPDIAPYRVAIVEDKEAPTVEEMVPAPGTTVPGGLVVVSFILAESDEEASAGIDVDSVRVKIDGQSVRATPQVIPNRWGTPARVLVSTEARLLDAGQHRVEIEAADRVGNRAVAPVWTFQAERSGAAFIGPGRDVRFRGDYTSQATDFNRDPGTATTVEGASWENRLNLAFIGPISDTWRVDATASLLGTQFDQNPTSPPAQGQLTEAHAVVESRRWGIGIGDVRVDAPGFMRDPVHRGAMSRQRFGAPGDSFGEITLQQFVEAERDDVTSRFAGFEVRRDRYGGRALWNWRDKVRLGGTYFRVEEEPSPKAIDTRVASAGHAWGVDLDARFFQNKASIQGVYVQTFEYLDVGNTIPIRADYMQIRGMYNHGTWSLSGDYTEADPDFGFITASGSRDEKSWSSSFNATLTPIVRISAGYRYRRDNLQWTKQFATENRTVTGSMSFSIPRAPTLTFNYSTSEDESDNLPRSVNDHSNNYGVNLSYNFKSITISGGGSVSESRRGGLTPSLSDNRSANASLNWRINPRFTVGMNWSGNQSRNLLTGSTTQSRSTGGNFSIDVIPNIIRLTGAMTFSTNRELFGTQHTSNRDERLGLEVRPRFLLGQQGAVLWEYNQSNYSDYRLTANNYENATWRASARVAW